MQPYLSDISSLKKLFVLNFIGHALPAITYAILLVKFELSEIATWTSLSIIYSLALSIDLISVDIQFLVKHRSANSTRLQKMSQIRNGIIFGFAVYVILKYLCNHLMNLVAVELNSQTYIYFELISISCSLLFLVAVLRNECVANGHAEKITSGDLIARTFQNSAIILMLIIGWGVMSFFVGLLIYTVVQSISYLRIYISEPSREQKILKPETSEINISQSLLIKLLNKIIFLEGYKILLIQLYGGQANAVFTIIFTLVGIIRNSFEKTIRPLIFSSRYNKDGLMTVKIFCILFYVMVGVLLYFDLKMDALIGLRIENDFYPSICVFLLASCFNLLTSDKWQDLFINQRIIAMFHVILVSVLATFITLVVGHYFGVNLNFAAFLPFSIGLILGGFTILATGRDL